MDLRDELDSRSLSAKGLKSQLIARLTKALIMEEEMDTAAKAVSVLIAINIRVSTGVCQYVLTLYGQHTHIHTRIYIYYR